MPISDFQLQAMQQRLAVNRRRRLAAEFTSALSSPESESELHDQIIDYARQHEFVIVHSRMDKASTTAVGVADFVLLLPEGKTVIVECKRKGSKPTPQQLGFIAHCKKNGHTAAVVWSFAEFLELVKQV